MAPVRALADNPIIIRGLVEGVTLAATKFLSIAPQLYKLAPIRQIILVDTNGAIDEIAEIAMSPYVNQLVSLSGFITSPA